MINKKERQFLFPSECSTLYFYHLPKVHKSLINPPGRPIVASTNSFTNGLSVHIFFFYNPWFVNFHPISETQVKLLKSSDTTLGKMRICGRLLMSLPYIHPYPTRKALWPYNISSPIMETSIPCSHNF